MSTIFSSIDAFLWLGNQFFPKLFVTFFEKTCSSLSFWTNLRVSVSIVWHYRGAPGLQWWFLGWVVWFYVLLSELRSPLQQCSFSHIFLPPPNCLGIFGLQKDSLGPDHKSINKWNINQLEINSKRYRWNPPQCCSVENAGGGKKRWESEHCCKGLRSSLRRT